MTTSGGLTLTISKTLNGVSVERKVLGILRVSDFNVRGVPVKASAAEVTVGTDDAKFVTPKGIFDSVNVPNVAPGSSGNVLTSDGLKWTSSGAAAGADGWIPAGIFTYASATTITVPTGAASKYAIGDRIRLTQPRSQAYTNDPEAGSNIELNMTDTSGFNVGNKVLVSSSAGSEVATVTVVHANTHLTVNVLALNHTTTNPMVYIGTTTTGIKYFTISSIADTVLTVSAVSLKYTLENAAITNPYYSHALTPIGYPDSLPANTFPLGNRSAAGEFVQRGTLSQTSSNTAWTLYQVQDILITYPVAFSTAPVVLVGLSTTADKVVIPGGYYVTTTAFRLFPSTTNSGVSTFTNIGWVALGA